MVVKKISLLRWTMGILLVGLILMVGWGWWNIDIQSQPIFFIGYFSGAAVLAVVVFILAILDILQIQKTIKKSLVEDEKFLIATLIKGVQKEREMSLDDGEPPESSPSQ